MWRSTFGCTKPQRGLLTHLPLAQAATGCLQCSMPIAKGQQHPAVGNRSLKDGDTRNDTWKITAHSPNLGFSRNQCAVVGHCLRNRVFVQHNAGCPGSLHLQEFSQSANWNAGYPLPVEVSRELHNTQKEFGMLRSLLQNCRDLSGACPVCASDCPCAVEYLAPHWL